MCGIDVVEAITVVAATPSVPLTTMFHAAHRPGLATGSGRARRPVGCARGSGSSTANSRNGTSMTRRRATWRSGTRPMRAAATTRTAVRRRTPRTAPSAWRRRRTRTAAWPAACTAAPAGAAGLPGAPAGAGARRPSSARWRAGRVRRRRRGDPPPANDPHDARRRRRTSRRCRRRRRGRSPRRRCRRRGRRSRRTGRRRGRGRWRRRRCPLSALTFSSPSGLALACGATNTTSAIGDDQTPIAHEGERRDAAGRAHVSRPLGDDARPATARARCRGRRTRGPGASPCTEPTASAVMMPSPMPIRAWTPIIAPATELGRDGVVAADGVLADEHDRGQHGRGEGGEPGRQSVTDGAVASEHLADQEEDAVAGEGADEGHVDDVQPERREPAVGEQHGLDDEHDGDGQRAGVRPDEHGGEHAAEEVAARAVGDREVEHLGGEHERRGEPDDGDVPVLERRRRLPQAPRDAADRHDGRRPARWVRR